MLCWMIYVYHVVLFHTHFFMLSSVFWSTCTYQYTNYCSIQKISLTVWKIKISVYLDIATQTMHVFIYKYQSFYSIDIAIYCELQWHIQQCLYSSNFAVTHEITTCNNFLQKYDFIWVMKYIYHTLRCTILSLPRSFMHNFQHSKRVHKVIWHNTCIFYIYNDTYYDTIIFPIHVKHITDIHTNYMKWQFFYTYDTAIWYMYICAIITTLSNYQNWSTFQNNTSYIHQDILIHLIL